MAEYSYRSTDESLLTPALYTFFVNPLVKILPYWLPANFITLGSFLFIIAAFLIAVRGYYTHTYDYWWAIPLLALCYVVGDCADGKQARKTNTGSPLGEYLDHFLDSFVTGLLMGILLMSFRVTNAFVIISGFFCLYIGQIATFWERYKSRTMYFGLLSTSEGTLAIAFTSWLMAFKPIRTLGEHPFALGICYKEIPILMCMFLCALTAVQAFMRTRHLSLRLILHLVLVCAFIIFLSYFHYTDMLYITLVVTLYQALFLASLLSATALNTVVGAPDPVVPLSCILFFIAPHYAQEIKIGQMMYLLIRIGIRFTRFFRLHTQYWHWINPPLAQ